MKLMAITVAAALAFASFSPTIEAGKPEEKGKPAHTDKAKGHKDHSNKGDGGQYQNQSSSDVLRRAVIDRVLLERYGQQYQVGGYKPLPPGIRKNMARGKPIPPGIAKTRLPQGYVNSLPRYEGYEWRGYGSDLVLVHLLSNKIADVILDALD